MRRSTLPITCTREERRGTVRRYQACASKKRIGPPYTDALRAADTCSSGCAIACSFPTATVISPATIAVSRKATVADRIARRLHVLDRKWLRSAEIQRPQGDRARQCGRSRNDGHRRNRYRSDRRSRCEHSFAERDDQKETTAFQHMADQYFRVMGVSLKRGRSFGTGNGPKSAPVGIVGESLADRLWPNEDPVGKLVRVESRDESNAAPWITIVGVVSDVYHPLGRSAQPLLYLPYTQDPAPAHTGFLSCARHCQVGR